MRQRVRWKTLLLDLPSTHPIDLQPRPYAINDYCYRARRHRYGLVPTKLPQEQQPIHRLSFPNHSIESRPKLYATLDYLNSPDSFCGQTWTEKLSIR